MRPLSFPPRITAALGNLALPHHDRLKYNKVKKNK
jgi:hypothetical protein